MNWTTLASGFDLAEAPTVLPDGSLAVSDVLTGGVFRIGDDGERTTLVPKRRGIGGMAVHADGGLVIGGRDLQWVRDGVSLPVFAAADSLGFNDFACDSAGRMYVGSVRYRSLEADAVVVPGDLWRIDLDGSAVKLYGGVQQCNGVAISPDATTIYHADTRGHHLVVHDLHDDGSVATDRRHWPLGERSMPDGLAIDERGCIWVADHGAGRVVCFTPLGHIDQVIEVPAKYVTSLCFRRHQLVVVSARRRDTAGTVMAVTLPVAGAPVHACRVRAREEPAV